MNAVQYNVHYSVLADSRLEAITKATEMLRTGVKVRGVVEAEQSTPGWYSVILAVEEDV
jgi:hypothetical protein